MAMQLIRQGSNREIRQHVAFEIYKLDGTYTQVECSKSLGKNMVFRKVEKPCGYLIKLPKKTQHGEYSPSVHLDTWAKVVAAGFGYGPEPMPGDIVGEAPTIDEDGEPSGSVPNVIKRTSKGRMNVDA